MKPLPEGCELTLNVFCTCDETGLNMVIGLKGMKVFLEGPVDTASFLEMLPDDDWRVMTRAEIIQYKADEESDQ